MKPSPLSAVLADDLLLDRVGARLDTDDDLGSLLLAVAHQADTPIPPAVRPRRRRGGHRGLTVLAALGVAVSGATVAAAVELAPTPADAASGAPHTRTFLPPSLQALVMPFLAGTPFQGRLVLPFGSLPTVPFVGTATAAGLPGSTFPAEGLALPASSATPGVDSELGHQEQQDLSRQKTQAKGTQTTGQGQSSDQGNQGNQVGSGTTEPDGDDQGEQSQSTPTPKPPKPTPTPTPTQTGQANGAGNGANGQANGAGNGNGATNGQGNGHGRTTTGTTTEGTTDGTATGTTAGDDTGDDPVSGGPDKHGKAMRSATGETSGSASTGTPPSKAKTAGGTAPATTTPTSEETATAAGTVAGDDGTVTP